MQVGDLVKIKEEGTMWDNKTAKIESINEEDNIATCFVDFIPEQGKRIRQDFSMNRLVPLNNESLKESLREDMEDNIIKEIDWNGHHYTFTNTYKNTGTKSHDYLTMTDDNGNSWTGETTWINRPWHRFDLEEAFHEVMSKAFGPKALALAQEISKTAHSVEGAIETFFEKFSPEDISSNEVEHQDTSEEARKQALASYLEVNLEEVEESGDNEFDVNGATYRVLTDDEADDAMRESIRNLWDDLGIEGVGGWMRDWILENAVDNDRLKDEVEENIRYDVDENMSDDDVVAECISNDIISEESAYDEDGNIREEVDMDDLRDKLIETRLEDVDSYAEYLKDLGFEDDFFKDYIDDEKAIDALVDDVDVNGSGRGQELAYYDGDELELDNGFYAYRTN